jgi:hypothetical protein
MPEFPDQAPPGAPIADPERNRGTGTDNLRIDRPADVRGDDCDELEPSDRETDLMIRARVVDLVRHHHRPRRRPATDQPIDPGTWPEAWPDAS